MTKPKAVVYRCGAKTQPGARYEACHIAVLPEGSRCRRHGGASLKGKASPSYVDGSWSKYELPVQYQAAYREFLKDPQWIDLKAEIAMSRAALQDLILRRDEFAEEVQWRDEVRMQQESLRRMVETEVRRVKAEQMAIPIEMAVFFAQRVTDIAIEAIRVVAKGGDERHAISQLSAGIKLLTTGSGGDNTN